MENVWGYKEITKLRRWADGWPIFQNREGGAYYAVTSNAKLVRAKLVDRITGRQNTQAPLRDYFRRYKVGSEPPHPSSYIPCKWELVDYEPRDIQRHKRRKGEALPESWQYAKHFLVLNPGDMGSIAQLSLACGWQYHTEDAIWGPDSLISYGEWVGGGWDDPSYLVGRSKSIKEALLESIIALRLELGI
jgi:hypothetical protein